MREHKHSAISTKKLPVQSRQTRRDAMSIITITDDMISMSVRKYTCALPGISSLSMAAPPETTTFMLLSGYFLFAARFVVAIVCVTKVFSSLSVYLTVR